jgi:hypothetical protein
MNEIRYKNIIKLRLPEIQMLAVVPTQLKFSIVKDHDEPTILLSETLFCMWECFNMGTELPTKVMLGQTLVLMQMTFLNNVRKVGRLVLSRTSCYLFIYIYDGIEESVKRWTTNVGFSARLILLWGQPSSLANCYRRIFLPER